MKNISHILKGWYNYIKGQGNEVAVQRSTHCLSCDAVGFSKYYNHIKEKELKYMQGLICTKCGCPLSTKLRAEKTSCPLNKW